MLNHDRISVPILRESELNSTHSRYDYAVAAPLPDALQIQFGVLSVINAIVATASLIVLVALLRSRTVLRQSFNLYLLFIVLPDFLASAACCCTCVLRERGAMRLAKLVFGVWFYRQLLDECRHCTRIV